MLKQVRKTITRYSMLPAGASVGVAVSGGADSVCLLLVLVELAKEFAVSLSVVHFNHKLRGADSDADEQFVRDLAARLDLPLFCEQATEVFGAGNLEQLARNARYRFFRKLMEGGQIDRIAVGHTRDDQAETVLFRILRGAGSAGIAGIYPVSPPVPTAQIIRPLLAVQRPEVESFLNSRGAVWRYDESNQDQRFARNRIRHSLLPELEQNWNPQLRTSLARWADLAFEEERWWRGEMAAILERLCRTWRGGLEINAGSLTGLPLAVSRRLVRAMVEQVKGDLRRFEFEHIESVLGMAGPSSGRCSLHLPDVRVTRSCGQLLVSRVDPLTFKTAPVSITAPGKFLAPDGSYLWIEACEPEGQGTPLSDGGKNGVTLGSTLGVRLGVTLKAAVWSGPDSAGLILRGWRPGDRYQPQGRSMEHDLKDMFQGAKIPSWRRPFWPIVTYGGSIAWAKQFGAAREFAMGASDVAQFGIGAIRLWCD